MNAGDIVLIPFPYAELTQVKVRPAVVISQTEDIHKDLIVSAISSVVPAKLGKREFVLIPNATNKLRVKSVVKTDRIVTLKSEDKIANLGKLSSKELQLFKKLLHEMIG
ncbi:MAG: type II toxin-antitoxin system PemK/MazF family toxin [Bacteroidetes bacterium]|nr:type II toxin-antitoxin system PemK/MazF family toxin [Bacteroidota bacterium]